MALLSRAPRAASVVATRPSILLVAKRDALEAVAEQRPEVAVELAAHCRRSMVANLGRTSAVLIAVPPQERSMLVERFQTRIFEKGEKLVVEGAHPQGLHLVASGEVAVVAHENGESIVVATLAAGETVGEVALILRRKANADVIAIHPTVTLFLPREEFMALVQDHPAILHGLYMTAVRRDDETIRALDSAPRPRCGRLRASVKPPLRVAPASGHEHEHTHEPAHGTSSSTRKDDGRFTPREAHQAGRLASSSAWSAGFFVVELGGAIWANSLVSAGRRLAPADRRSRARGEPPGHAGRSPRADAALHLRAASRRADGRHDRGILGSCDDWARRCRSRPRSSRTPSPPRASIMLFFALRLSWSTGAAPGSFTTRLGGTTMAILTSARPPPGARATL
jgi:CRP-like cAMP-binding protein